MCLRRMIVAAAVGSVLATACAAGDPTTPPGGAPSDGSPAPSTARATPAAADDPRIWFEMLGVSTQAPGTGFVEMATDEASFRDLWARYGMDSNPPDVGFDEHTVLFYGRAEDACPDDLVALKRDEDVLEATWLPPPGGCEQPHIPTGYAVQVHRADLGISVVVLHEGDEGDAGDGRATFTLPPYDGPAAPPPPPVPGQPAADEVAAIFDGHPVRPCSEVGNPMDVPPKVDGPVSDDPAVADAQRGRAEMGFPSDQDTTKQRLTDPANLERGFDFPLSEEEYEEIWTRQDIESHESMHAYALEHHDTFGFLYIDQQAGGVWTYGFTEGLEDRRAELQARFPDAATAVVEAPYTVASLEAAAEPVLAAMQDEPDLGISSLAVGLTRVEVGLIDTTRDTLDVLAGLTDPGLLCVQSEFSGVPAD